MSNSLFDPTTFLHATLTEPSVRRPLIPATLNLKGIIGEPKPDGGQRDDGSPYLRFDIPIELDLSTSADAYNAVNLDNKGEPITHVTLTDRIFVDLKQGTAGQLVIDNGIGKNSKMRRYREATDLNTAGQEFNFAMMQGRQVLVKVKHREYQGNILEDIDNVAKA